VLGTEGGAMLSYESIKCSFLNTILCSVCVLAAFVSSASAQGQSQAVRFGRLPDGRAYRIDGQGYRLVDQLAELEVTTDDLKRQVQALENELTDKQKTIDKLQAGLPLAGPGVKESTITPEAKTQTVKGNSSKPSDPPNCNELISNSYLKVTQLERQLKEASQRNVLPAAAAPARCDYNSAENPWKYEAARLERALAEVSTRSVADGSLAAEAKRAEELEEKLGRTEAEAKHARELEKKLGQTEASLDVGNDKISALNEELALAKKQVASLHSDLANTRAKLEEQIAAGKDQAKEEPSELSRASLAAAHEVKETESKEEETPKPQINPVVVEQSKKEFQSTLARIQEQIIKRKDLLDQQKSRGQKVSIQIQQLVTSKGTTLDQLRQQVTTLNQDANVDSIREGLKQIEQLLSDDIGVMQRLIQLR
jgi:DNA repair exonuclease SbcCD ATPase subunit